MYGTEFRDVTCPNYCCNLSYKGLKQLESINCIDSFIMSYVRLSGGNGWVDNQGLVSDHHIGCLWQTDDCYPGSVVTTATSTTTAEIQTTRFVLFHLRHYYEKWFEWCQMLQSERNLHHQFWWWFRVVFLSCSRRWAYLSKWRQVPLNNVDVLLLLMYYYYYYYYYKKCTLGSKDPKG